MGVTYPGFSERVFEFSFNSEYTDRNRAVLASVPHIPTQNQERSLGYDVMFEVQQRHGAIHCVALQHKVARYVDGKAKTNAHFWKAASGPYYAFALEKDQYNLIEQFASQRIPGVEVYYCAPLFATHISMNTHFLQRKVELNSLWIDVAGAGQIPDSDNTQHTLVYSPDGLSAYRFSSEPVPIGTLRLEQWSKQALVRQRANAPDLDEIRLHKTVHEILEEYWPRLLKRGKRRRGESHSVPTALPEKSEPNLVNSARVLAQYYGLSLLVQCRQ